MTMDNELEYLRKENERLRKALSERQVSVALSSLTSNHELIEDLARYQEGLYTQQQVKKKWREAIDEKTWNELGSDNELVQAIEARRVQRVRSGAFKRERAQQHVTRAPDALAAIMDDSNANHRHVVDAIKTLDHLADPGPRTASDADRFIVHIDLTADAKLKSTEPDPNDIIVIDVPRKTPAAITDQSEDDWKR
jgi:hypothetical protein